MGELISGRGGYAVGIASIDAMHVELEDRLAALQEDGVDVRVALAALQDHLQRHFAHEEFLMAETDFPMAACHGREHASVIEVVTEVQRLLEAGDEAPLGRLAPAMLEWFAVHASGMDAALAAHLKQSAQTAA